MDVRAVYCLQAPANSAAVYSLRRDVRSYKRQVLRTGAAKASSPDHYQIEKIICLQRR